MFKKHDEEKPKEFSEKSESVPISISQIDALLASTRSKLLSARIQAGNMGVKLRPILKEEMQLPDNGIEQSFASPMMQKVAEISDLARELSEIIMDIASKIEI